MVDYVIDTNVLSELSRAAPDPRVVTFLAGVSDAWISVIVFQEMSFGIWRMEDPQRRLRLFGFVEMYKARFKDRIVAVDLPTAEIAGRFRAAEAGFGRKLAHMDALIAACAFAKGATLATRNAKDFEYLGIPLFNPWDGP